MIPLFYQRDADGLPGGWIARMKETIAQLVPQYNTHRMVREYVERFYLPGQARFAELAADRERVQRLTPLEVARALQVDAGPDRRGGC